MEGRNHYYAVQILINHLIDKGCKSYSQASTEQKMALAGCYLSNKYDTVLSKLLNEKNPDKYTAKFNTEFSDVVDAILCINIQDIIKQLSLAVFEWGFEGRIRASTAVDFTKAFCLTFIKHYPDAFSNLFDKIISNRETSKHDSYDDEEREMFWFDVSERVKDMKADEIVNYCCKK